MNGETTRFASRRLSRVALLLAQGLVDGYRPDVVHAHDWQAGLTPAYLHYEGVYGARDGDDAAQPGVPGPLLCRLPVIARLAG